MSKIILNIVVVTLSLLLITFNTVGQTKNELAEREKIDQYLKEKDVTISFTDSMELSEDSIGIKVKRFKDGFVTSSHFLKSNRYLNVNYFFKDKNLIYVTVANRNKTDKEANPYSNYYFTKDTIVYEFHFEASSNNLNKSIGQEISFSNGFVKQYIAELLIDIKAQPSNAWKRE